MPIYEFKCPACGQQSEQLCRMGANGEALACPCCGHTGLKKLLSGFAAPGSGGAGGCAGCNSKNCGSCH